MVGAFDFGWNGLGLSSDLEPLFYVLSVSFHSQVYTFSCTHDWQLFPVGKQLSAVYWEVSLES